jgi:hypothetical protein
VTRGAAAALLPAVALALAGCSKTIDERDAEAKIAATVRKTSGAQLAVDCPGGVPSKKGERFTCTAEVAGRPIDIHVEVLSDDGRLRLTEVRPRNPVP